MSQMPRACVVRKVTLRAPTYPLPLSYPLPTYQYHCNIEKWAMISVPLYNVSIIVPCQYHFTISVLLYHVSTIVPCQYRCTMSALLYYISTITLALCPLVLRTGQMSMECSIRKYKSIYLLKQNLLCSNDMLIYRQPTPI